MGYNSDYYVSAYNINGESIDTETLATHMDEIADGFGNDFEHVIAGLDTLQLYDKWYSADDDMVNLSRKHPDLCYRVFVRGEDGEEYVQFYVDGQMEEHERPEWSPPLQPTNLTIQGIK